MATVMQLPRSAQQPAATTTLQQPLVIDKAALARLGALYSGKFTQYESDRKLAELKWTRNARQYLGVYDPDVDAAIDKNRSRAYPKLTRVKCVSMLSRLMNLLFPVGEKNWTVAAPAVPDLSQEDLQEVLDTLMPQQAPGAGAPPAVTPSDEDIEQAIRKFATKRAKRMEVEIEDQLQELGGNKAQDYVALCRKVLMSGIQYGCGILRGPFVEEQKGMRWQIANGRLVALEEQVKRPRFEFVPIWDYYPDMGAKIFAQMDGQFVRLVMSKHQINMLKKRPDFMDDQIEKFMRESPSGNYRRRTFESDLRSLGSQINTSQSESNKFEALVWEGFIPGRDLSLAGARVPDDKLDEDVRGTLWMLGNTVIKADIDPWSVLAPDDNIPQFHHFVFEEDESFLLGNALPNIMRDSQMGVCAGARMMIDNGSVQRVFEVNDSLLRLDQDVSVINPDMVIRRDDENPAQTAQYPAVRPIELPMNLQEMKLIVEMFMSFADAETFVNAATGGDMQKGPSEPFRTAAGASMLRGDAALPFKDVVRNFDIFTESVIGAVLVFNKVFSTNDNIRGEFAAVARGATSLIAKEVQGAQLDNLAQTLTPEEKRYLNMRELARARVRARDLDSTQVVLTDKECDQVDAQVAQQQAKQQDQQDRQVEASLRKLLSDALKNIAQASKNSAGAEATTANVVLAALEKGLNPDALLPPKGEGDGSGSGPGASAAGADTQQPAGPGAINPQASAGAAPAAAGPAFAAMPSG